MEKIKKYSFTPIQNSKSLAKPQTLNARTSELIAKENSLKFLPLQLPFYLFLIKILQLKCDPEYFGEFFS